MFSLGAETSLRTLSTREREASLEFRVSYTGVLQPSVFTFFYWKMFLFMGKARLLHRIVSEILALIVHDMIKTSSTESPPKRGAFESQIHA